MNEILKNKKLSNPYEGSSEKEFVDYIQKIFHNDTEEIKIELREIGEEDAARDLHSLFHLIKNYDYYSRIVNLN